MSDELKLKLRIVTSAENTPQVLSQTARDITNLASSTSAASQRITAGMSSAATSSQLAARTMQASTGSMTAGMSSAASSTQIAAASIANSLRAASSSSRASMQSMTESMVVSLHQINTTLAALDAKIVVSNVTSSAALGKTVTASSGLVSVLGSLRSIVPTIGIGLLAKDIFDTNREFESLRMQLNGVMGSAAAGGMAFHESMKWAVKTPFELKDITQAFITLKNFGIDPASDTMASITNQASRLGKGAQGLTTLTMQLGQAWTKGSLQMQDMHILMEAGVPVIDMLRTVTGKTGAEIAKMSENGEIGRESIKKLIDEMGRVTAGSNEAAMRTLNGQISNLSDAWHNFEDTLLNDKSEGLIKSIVASFTETINMATRNMSDSIDAQIAHTEARIKTRQSLGAAGKFVSDILGDDPNLDRNRLDALNRKKAAQDAADAEVTINKNRAAAIKETNDWLAEIVAADATKAEKAAKDAVKKATDEAISAAKALQNAYDSIFNSMQKEIALRGNTTRSAAMEYDVTVGALSRLSEAKKLKLLQDAAELDNQALLKKASDAQKTTMDALDDKYRQLTLSARDYFIEKTKIDNLGITPEQLTTATSKFDRVAAAGAEKTKIDETRSSLDAYSKSLDSAHAKTTDLQSITSAVFDGALGGVNLMAGAFDKMITSIDASTEAMDELHKNQLANAAWAATSEKDKATRAANTAKFAMREIELNDEVFRNKLSATRQITGAVSTMFKEGSTAQRIAHAITVGLATAELAMNAQKLYGISAVTAAETASIGPEVAASTAKGTAKAAEAVATQATAGPYIGFALMAAMAAAMAAIGFGVGGSSDSVPKTLPLSPETGTVLGDKNAASESLNNVYELLKSIHAEEYPELRGIARGVTGLRDGIQSLVTTTFKTAGLKSTLSIPTQTFDSGRAERDFAISVGISAASAVAATGILGSAAATIATAGMSAALNAIGLTGLSATVSGGVGGGAGVGTMAAGTGLMAGMAMMGVGVIIAGIVYGVSKLLGIGETTVTQTGGGIKTSPTKIGDIMDGKNLRAQQYAVAEVVTKGWFSDDKSTSVVYAAINKKAQQSLNAIGIGIGQAMLSIAEPLGKEAGKDFSAKVLNYTLPAITYETFGLNAKKSTDRLNKIVSNQLDRMAKSIFPDIVKTYQETGEGAMQTVSRILSEVTVVKDKLALSGLALLKENAIAASDALIHAAGDIKTFQENFENYYDKFFSAEEKHSRIQTALTGQFDALNLLLPKTRDGYRAVIEGLDLNNKADQERYSVLIAQADAADAYYKTIEENTKTYRGLEIQLMEMTGDAAGALAAKRRDELAAMDESLRLSARSKYAIEDASAGIDTAMKVVQKSISDEKKALQDKLKNETDALKISLGLSDAAKKASENAKTEATTALTAISSIAGKLRSAAQSANLAVTDASLHAAQSVIASALAIGRTGASIANVAGLDSALAEIAKPSTQLYTTFLDYERDQLITSANIKELSSIADSQEDVAKLTLKAITDGSKQAQESFDKQLKVLTATYDFDVANLDKQLTSAQDQVDAVNGNTKAITSVAEAMTSLAAALNAKVNLIGGTAVEQHAGFDKDVNGNYTTTPVTLTAGGAVSGSVPAALAADNAATAAASALQTAVFNNKQSSDALNAASAVKMTAQQTLADAKSTLAAAEAATKGTAKAKAAAIATATTAYETALTAFNTALSGQLSARASYGSTIGALSTAKAVSAATTATAAATALAIPSLDVGIDSVPYDMLANIHKEERILPAADNRELMMRLSEPRVNIVGPIGNGGSDNSELIAAIRALQTAYERQQAENEKLRTELEKITTNTGKTERVLTRVTRDGESLRTTPA